MARAARERSEKAQARHRRAATGRAGIGPMIAVAAACFAASGLCALYRVVRGPSLADRVIAVEVALVCLAGGIVIDATNRDSHTLLAIITVIALVGLAGTFAASRFLERDADGADGRTAP